MSEHGVVARLLQAESTDGLPDSQVGRCQTCFRIIRGPHGYYTGVIAGLNRGYIRSMQEGYVGL